MSVWSPKPNFPCTTLPRPKHAGGECTGGIIGSST